MKKILGIALVCTLLYACERNNILTQNQWGDIFKKYNIDSACFELSDNNHDQILIYNLARASKRFCPASTFKIMNSLIALETNIAPDENLTIPWDGVIRREEWNKDMNMRTAFEVSCVPYYQELARRIGAIEMQKWLDTVRYGNKNINGALDMFWLNDTLTISPDEQVGLMKKLYFDKLPFSQRSQRIVRSLMLHEDSSAYKLYYKTGTFPFSQNDKKKLLLWVVGFAEKKEVQKAVGSDKEETHYKPYFFALNYETEDTSNIYRTQRIEILKEILKERKILP